MYYKNSSELNVELSDSDMNPIFNNNITIKLMVLIIQKQPI